MESRKVQITGGSSFIITLPKEWARTKKLKKGDTLKLISQDDGSLLINTSKFSKPEFEIKEFKIDDLKDPVFLFRLLIGAYIVGFSVFLIKSKKKINPDFKRAIYDFVNSTIGTEIIEEKMTRIKIKDLLDPKELPLIDTINRIYLLAKSMHENSITALSNKDISLLKDVINKDFEVDRLNWMIARHANMLLRDIILSRQMKISQSDAIFFSLISKYFERIADHAVRISKNALIVLESKINDELIRSIKAASKEALSILDKCIDSWTRNDIKSANNNIESISNLISACEEIDEIAIQMKGKYSIAISYIAESIRRTGEYSADISELTINHLISK
ncbi:MAG: PhoU domain-containing protein [Candidatus Helarchaeota archaeon]